MSFLRLWTTVAIRALTIVALSLCTLGLACGALGALLAAKSWPAGLFLGLGGLATAFYVGRNCWLWTQTTRRMIDGDLPPSLSVDMQFLSLGNLLVMAAVFAILCAIALPMFSGLIRKSSEGASKGNLAAMRALLQSHHAAKGSFPTDLAALGDLPRAKTPNYHPDSAQVAFGAATDAGGWLYDNAAGTLRVNCTHTDTKGTVWTMY